MEIIATGLQYNQEAKSLNDKQTKMSLQQFGPWLQEKAGAAIKTMTDRTDCVVSIDHIEPGSFVALYAVNSADGLVVVELAAYFNSESAAWEALANGEETYPPVPFNDWVEQQYLTDREAKVERLEL